MKNICSIKSVAIEKRSNINLTSRFLNGMPGPGPPPPITPQQEMEDTVRRLDILRGNTPDVSPANTPAQNSRIIARQNEERFQNRQIREREREISNIPKGIVNKRKSSTNFNFPDMTPMKKLN